MSNIPTDVLLEHAGSDYDDLPADVKAMIDDADTELAQHGVDVDADMKATEDADVLDNAPTPNGVTSTTKPKTESTATSFSSRGKARTYANEHGLRVIDNGPGDGERWGVGPKATATAASKPKTRKARTVPATATKPGKADKKTVAMQVYSELDKKGTLKRSNFISEMSTRTGLSEKGASSYFYRIKGGQW